MPIHRCGTVRPQRHITESTQVGANSPHLFAVTGYPLSQNPSSKTLDPSSAAMAAGTETFAFPTEINRLLTLITTTFHSSKEIFFRELITNASDALGKIRLESLTDQSELDARNLSIHIFPDKVSNALTIFDNGVGMTKSELVNNLGRLGTKSARADVSMTGFGFYSVYLVAKRVVVTTKRQQGQQYVWESEAGGSFTVRKGGASYGRGTMITLFLKEDQLEYLDEHRLKDLVEKYSESISYPISVWPKEAIGNFSSDADADSWIRGVLSASEYRRLFFRYDRVFIMYTVRGVLPHDRMRAVRYLLHKLDVLEQGLQGICPLPGGYTVPEGSDDDDEGHVQ